MPAVQTFYLSRILGNKVWSSSNRPIGKLVDLIVDVTSERPHVIAVKLKTGKKIQFVDFSTFAITKRNQQYYIETKNLIEKKISKENTLFLVKHILDKQIVDMDGRKVVRVNDLRLAILANGVFLVAADIGFEGLLRRLGVAKPLKRILKPLGINIPGRFLLWDEVEAIDFFRHGIKLSKSYTKLDTLHPSDLADIIEDLDRTTQLAVLSSLEVEKAADVLEELEIEYQVNVIENLETVQAAVMLQKMPADEVADILEEIDDEQAEEILSKMERDVSEEVRELMDYPEESVGSIMTTEFISFNENATIFAVIEKIRELKPDSESIYYIYIVDEANKLLADLSFRDLFIEEPETKLVDIMNREVIYVTVDEDIEILNEIISKYNLAGLPVVDEQMTLIGMVHIHDIVHNILQSTRRRR